MSTFNKGQVPQTRTPSLKFTNNVICENSNSSSTEADTANAVFATRDKAFSKGILAIEGNLAGRHFDIIIDTGSAVSLISTSLWNQVTEKFSRTQVKSKYVVANGTTLPVEGSTELPIQIGGLEVVHRCIIVPTEVADILLGYDFLKINKCEIMTSVNTLVAGNVAIPTHSRLNITSIGIVAVADSTVEGFTEVIVPGQIEEHEVHLTYEQACLVEGDPLFEAKHGLLVEKSIVDPSKEIPLRVINTSMWSNKIYAGKRFANLSSLVMEKFSRNLYCSQK